MNIISYYYITSSFITRNQDYHFHCNLHSLYQMYSYSLSNRNCGGVKPRLVIEAQEHRFIKSTPEEEKSLRPVVGNSGARKCLRRLVQEEHPPRM